MFRLVKHSGSANVFCGKFRISIWLLVVEYVLLAYVRRLIRLDDMQRVVFLFLGPVKLEENITSIPMSIHKAIYNESNGYIFAGKTIFLQFFFYALCYFVYFCLCRDILLPPPPPPPPHRDTIRPSHRPSLPPPSLCGSIR